MKKKLFLALLVLVAPLIAKERDFTLYPPNVPAPHVVEADPPQTNTFCASNLSCAVTGAWSFSNISTLTVSGTATLALLNCKNIESSIFCVDTANTQGWAGADAGAQINSAITALPSTGGQIFIASGSYTVSTPIVLAQNATIQCPVGPATSAGRASLNFTPATGVMISASNAAFQIFGCDLKTTTSTTSVAIQLTHVSQSNIERNHINGFFGGVRTTGDGVAAFSIGVRINNNLIDGINALCSGGNGYGMSFDHTIDLYVEENEVYSVTDCATGFPMIMDTGAQGIWIGGNTWEQGKNAGIIRTTNLGGSYGGAPAAIFGQGNSWDIPPGGDALLFDSTLAASDIRFFCTNCWVAGAGRTTTNTIVTGAAVGLNVQGGGNIHWIGGTARVNASWGVVLGSSGTNISIEGMNVHANNQNNNANVGGIQVAGPTGWRIANVRSGNILESGGNQVWGLDISLASPNGVVGGSNDLRNNSSGRIRFPAGFGSENVDALEIGSLTGLHVIGPLMFPEGTAPVGVSGEEVCYGDSTAHSILCSWNNDAFGALAKVNKAATWSAAQTLGAGGSLNAASLLVSPTAPTIAGAGCGGSAASIVSPNGTAAFKINVGTAPTSACTITMPAAATGWNCFATDITTNSTTVFLQKQSGAESTTSVTITNFSDVAAASSFTANDILKVSCHAD